MSSKFPCTVSLISGPGHEYNGVGAPHCGGLPHSGPTLKLTYPSTFVDAIGDMFYLINLHPLIRGTHMSLMKKFLFLPSLLSCCFLFSRYWMRRWRRLGRLECTPSSPAVVPQPTATAASTPAWLACLVCGALAATAMAVYMPVCPAWWWRERDAHSSFV